MQIRSEVLFLFGSGASIKTPDPWLVVDTFEICRIYYIHGGTGYFLNNNTHIPLRRNKLYLFPPNLSFRGYSDPADPLVHTFIDFISKPPIILDNIIEMDVLPGDTLYYGIQTAESIMKQYPDILFSGAEYTPMSSCINLLLDLIIEKEHLHPVKDRMVLESLNLIHNGFRDNLQIHDIAAQLGYNTDYFIRKFKSIMKITPYTYLRSLRLHEAKRLLSLGCKQNEVAAQIGYSDTSSLNHALKKVDFEQLFKDF